MHKKECIGLDGVEFCGETLSRDESWRYGEMVIKLENTKIGDKKFVFGREVFGWLKAPAKKAKELWESHTYTLLVSFPLGVEAVWIYTTGGYPEAYLGRGILWFRLKREYVWEEEGLNETQALLRFVLGFVFGEEHISAGGLEISGYEWKPEGVEGLTRIAEIRGRRVPIREHYFIFLSVEDLKRVVSRELEKRAVADPKKAVLLASGLSPERLNQKTERVITDALWGWLSAGGETDILMYVQGGLGVLLSSREYSWILNGVGLVDPRLAMVKSDPKPLKKLFSSVNRRVEEGWESIEWLIKHTDTQIVVSGGRKKPEKIKASFSLGGVELAVLVVDEQEIKRSIPTFLEEELEALLSLKKEERERLKGTVDVVWRHFSRIPGKTVSVVFS